MGFSSLAAGPARPVESLSSERGQRVCQGFSRHSVQPTHPHSLFHQLRVSCFGALITAGKPPPLCHTLLGRSGSQVLPTGRDCDGSGRVSCPHLHVGIRGHKSPAFWFLWGKKKYLQHWSHPPTWEEPARWTVPGPLQSGHAHLNFCYLVV